MKDTDYYTEDFVHTLITKSHYFPSPSLVTTYNCSWTVHKTNHTWIIKSILYIVVCSTTNFNKSSIINTQSLHTQL